MKDSYTAGQIQPKKINLSSANRSYTHNIISWLVTDEINVRHKNEWVQQQIKFHRNGKIHNICHRWATVSVQLFLIVWYKF